MKSEEVLDLARRCNLKKGEVLIPGKAYLFNRKFAINYDGITKMQEQEIIVLTDNGVKVGCLYRMGDYDIHVVIKNEYQGKHILSDFARSGVMQKIWPENKDVELCGVYTLAEYEKKKYLVSLFGLGIKNKDKLDEEVKLGLLR